MRAREILEEDYNQNLKSDLNNILIGSKGSGVYKIDTPDLVNQLRRMGYSVNVNNIIPLLSDNPIVQNSTPEMIMITEPEAANAEADSEEDTAAQVSDMAKKASEKEKNK